MKKKFIIFGIVMLLVTALFSANVYAADTDTITSATITITPSKTEYTSGEKVEFTVSLKDLNASSGILGLGAYLSYDSNLLTVNSPAEGLSGWSPADISGKTNRFLTYKNSHSSNNEDIIKISFTAKDVTSDVTTSIGLKQIQISNSVEYRINEVNSNTITIKPKSNTPENPPVNPDDQDNPNNPNGSGQTSGDNGNDNNNNNNNNDNNNNNNTGLFGNSLTNGTTNTNSDGNKNSNSNIPSLGINGYIYIVIAIAMITAVISIIRIKMIDKKIKIEQQNFLDKNDKNK